MGLGLGGSRRLVNDFEIISKVGPRARASLYHAVAFVVML